RGTAAGDDSDLDPCGQDLPVGSGEAEVVFALARVALVAVDDAALLDVFGGEDIAPRQGETVPQQDAQHGRRQQYEVDEERGFRAADAQDVGTDAALL